MYNFDPFCVLDIARAIELLDKLQMSGEVPATKLAALQKVLQSDFLNGELKTPKKYKKY
jgi:hypothetical protein